MSAAPAVAPTHLLCSRCRRTLPADQFGFHADNTGRGHKQSWCQPCAAEHVRARRRADPTLRAADNAQKAAYAAAQARLRAAHRAEFDGYYAVERSSRGLPA